MRSVVRESRNSSPGGETPPASSDPHWPKLSLKRICGAIRNRCAPEPILHGVDLKVVKHADRSAKLALAAAKQAWENGCLTTANVDGQRIGVIIGSSRGPAGAALRVGAGRIRAIDAIYIAFSSIAGLVAAELGAANCAEMTSATCISGAVALRTAVAMLRDKELDVAVVGGVDAPLVEALI